MTIEYQCYVCGAEGLCINGLCPDCTMQELLSPGAAFAATFGVASEWGNEPYTEPCLICGGVGFHESRCPHFEEKHTSWGNTYDSA